MELRLRLMFVTSAAIKSAKRANYCDAKENGGS